MLVEVEEAAWTKGLTLLYDQIYKLPELNLSYYKTGLAGTCVALYKDDKSDAGEITEISIQKTIVPFKGGLFGHSGDKETFKVKQLDEKSAQGKKYRVFKIIWQV